MSLNIDKSRWKKFTFEQIASNISDRVDVPAESGLERYVGLEHLTPGNLRITRWADPSEAKAQKLRFMPGDVIFGRRRAYQRKVAQADFEGLCSAHALVLRANNDSCLEEFLPHFIASDTFMERAIEISVGSTSPTVNWRDLKRQEFLLPPIEEQRRIADLLWQFYNLKYSLNGSVKTLEKGLLSAYAHVAFSSQEHVLLSDLYSRLPESGRSRQPSVNGVGVRSITLSALTNLGFNAEEYKYVPFDRSLKAKLLSEGDLLISRANTRERVGLCSVVERLGEPTVFPDTIIRLSLNDVEVEDFSFLCNSKYGRMYFASVAAGSATSMVKINRTTLGNFPVPVEFTQGLSFLASLRERYLTSVFHTRYEIERLTCTVRTLSVSFFGGSDVH